MVFGPLKSGTSVFFGPNKVDYPSAPELYGCQQCKSWFNRGVLPKALAFKYYSNTKELRWDSKPFDKDKPNALVKFFKGRLQPGMKVLDIGCNHGIFLDFAKKLGCLTTGVEWNDVSRQMAIDKGHRMFQDISEVNDHYDFVTGFDIIEHMYDLPEFLATMKRVIRFGGTLAIFTGDIGSFWARILKQNFWYFQFPEHIVFPSKEFFEMQNHFRLLSSSRSAHAKVSINALLKETYWILKGIVWGRWNGFSSIFHDHVLFELKSK